jgi:hypothetical protein
MGILSSIGSVLKKAATAVVNSPVGAGLDALSYTFTHPIKAVEGIATGNFQKQEAAYFAQPLAKQETQTVISTIGYVGAVLGVGAVSKAASAGTLTSSAKTLAVSAIPKTVTGKIAAAVAVPVVLGAVAQNPGQTLGAVASAPGALANFGGNLGNLAANPSIANVETLIKENPVVATAAGAAIVAAVGGGIGLAANTVATFTNSQATKANTAATTGSASDTLAPSPITVTDRSGEMSTLPYTTATTATAPITPSTQKVSSGSSNASTRKRSRAKKSVMPSVKQNVSVIVQNKSSSVGIRQSKKYLNREVLLV